MLLWVALLVGSTGVLGQTVAAEQNSDTTVLIQRQGQQKQRLIQGQAATQLSQRDAKRLAAGARPDVPKKPISEADVRKSREERIRRLNAAKVEPAATP